MEQRIGFFTGRGGRKLACAVAGSGPPLVCAAWWVSHVEHDWELAAFRNYFARMAEHHTVVRYDRAGVGLSDRERDDFSLDGEVEDLEALARHLALPPFALYGQSCGAPVALAYAARHAARVERLVFCGGYADGSALARPEVQAALESLVRANWGIGSRALIDLFAPGVSPEDFAGLVAMQRRASSPAMAERLLRLTYALDASSEAAGVRAPAVVLHRRGDRAVPFEAGRRLAALLPAAELVPLEGSIHFPWYGDARATADAALRFLGGSSPAVAPADRSADLEGRTGVFRREGDVWRIAFAGRTVHVKHAKGLADLATLLGRPGGGVPATELAHGGPGGARTGADPVLDRRALASYRARLRDLDAALEEAEARADEGRLLVLAGEREAILGELGHAAGLGGRPRRLGDEAERARKAVSSRIRQSLAAIRAVHPELAEHLERALVIGITCSYSPEQGVAWEV